MVHGAGDLQRRRRPSRPSVARPGRLSPRRRIAAGRLASATVLLAGTALFGWPTGGTPAAAGPVPPGRAEPAQAGGPTASVVVRPGDTVWSIARRLQPSGEIRPLVDHLTEGRSGRALQPGEVLVVPG
jgi:nucleoid-associated protein YgaU